MEVELEKDSNLVAMTKGFFFFIFTMMSGAAISAECDLKAVDGVRSEKMGSEQGYISVASIKFESGKDSAYNSFLDAAELKAKEALINRVTKLPADSGYDAGPKVAGIKVLSRCISSGRAVAVVWISPETVEAARDLKKMFSDSFNSNPTPKPIDSPSLLEDWSDDPPTLPRRRQAQ